MNSILEVVLNKFTFYPHNKIMRPINELPKFVSERWITTHDGESLQSFYFKHPKDNKNLIIYFHGNTGNLFSHHRFEHAEQLYNMGVNVLLVSYRGYCKSTGKPNEQGIYNDGEAALNYAHKTLGYTDKDIYIFGRSLGTTVATHISQNRKFKGVVLITPLTSAKDMGVEMGFKYFSFFARGAFNSLKKIKNLKSKLLILHGTKDSQIPFKMGEKILNRYKGQKELVKIENAGHNNLQLVDPKLFWGKINTFIQD